jgi:hemolysin D
VAQSFYPSAKLCFMNHSPNLADQPNAPELPGSELPASDLSASELPRNLPGDRNPELTYDPLEDRAYDSLEDRADDDGWSSITQETLNVLPRAWTRGLLYLLIGLTAVVLPWAVFSKVDVVSSAEGRLEPKGKTIRLDAAAAGTIARITAKEGQQVKAGQSLMELESTVIRNDLQQAEAKLEGQTNRLSQLQLMTQQVQLSGRAQQQQSLAQAAEQAAQMTQTGETYSANLQAIASAQELLLKDQSRIERFRTLAQQGILSGSQVEDAERTMIENKQRLQQTQAALQQTQTEVQKQRSTYQRVLHEGELALISGEKQAKELQAQISDIQAEMLQTQNQIKSLRYQWQQRVISAPVSGTIFQLPIQNPGAVVQPGTLIAQIAPQGARIVLRSQIDSQDMGFLRVGLPVKVKLDAYPFQEYGIVPGRLTWISPDSKMVQVGQSQQEIFELEIELAQPYIEAGNQRILLTPGQTATAEVVVRQRRLIDFLTDPFKQLQKGGLNF